MTYVDATCPLVSKVHREAENLHKSGYHLILIGHQNHPEVFGTMGQLPNGSIDLIQNEDEAKKYAKILGYNYNSSKWFEQTYIIFNKDYKLPEIKNDKDKDGFLKKIIKKIVKPTLLALKRRGKPYSGFLYVGLMIKKMSLI